MIKILIADDHALFRDGLRRILAQRSDWIVAGEANNGRVAVALARTLRPDIVIVDFAMPELNGLEATRQIRAALPHTEVLILTMFDSEQLAREVLAAGARGIVLKSDAGPTLLSAVENLIQHQPFFTSKVSAMLLDGYLHPDQLPRTGDPLTPREREVLQLIAEGHSSKAVAETLGVSVKTAETHRANLMRKLHAHSVSELVHYAIRNQIVAP